ncbi:MAG: chromosomal replication initiator protein DnaA [Caldilineaceae bacterium]|nr:chromosomal replication initiator protein DnaA [Caldilineaceae bacterium]
MPDTYTEDGADEGEYPSVADDNVVEWASSEALSSSSPNSQPSLRRDENSLPSSRAGEVWQMALTDLALSMPGPTYETWVRDTSVMGYEDGEFVIGVPHAYARDWLQNRLRPQIKRILSRLLQRSVEVTFRVRPRPVIDPEQRDAPPLYQPLSNGDVKAESPVRARSGAESRRRGPVEVAEFVSPEPPVEPPHPTPPHSREGAGSTPPPQWGRLGGGEQLPPEPSVRQTPEAKDNRPFPPTPAWNGERQRLSAYSSRTEMDGTPLNPHYTFASFIVGSNNRLAHAAALSVADHPGYRFNPLFVYGGVGLGKTHLLHAIGHQMLERGLRVLYCSSEQFTNELISGIRSQSTEEFRNKYRQVDLLLIDDIQFIGGKESTQEEFFHTFNHLHAASRQVVISSDRPPKEIATLEARLRSRFEGGLQADISTPDLETRVAILQSKALAMGARIDPDVLMLVAERVDSNIRELEGALNRLIIQSPLHHNTLDRQMAEGILNDLMPQRRPREASGVIELVAAHFSLTVAELLGRGRTKEVAYARQIAMFLLREENELSLPTIGDQLGGRDHSTIRYGVEKVTNDLETDETTRRHVVTLREKVYAPPGAF